MYLFFDTETTGIPKNWKAPLTDFENWPRLVQLAFQLFDDEGILINEEDYIIKPHGFKIPPESTAIHGITNEQATSEGISLSSVLDDFSSILEDVHTIVAHNLSFDEKIVGCEYLRMGLPNPLVEKNRICTMESSTNYCEIVGLNGYKWPKLSELYFKLFNTELEETHNALVDIRATSKCFWELVIRDIIKLNQTSSFNLNNLSKNKIEDEKAKLSDDQIKNLIEEYHSLKKKVKSISKRWNFLNNALSGYSDYEEMKEEIEEWEALDSLLTEVESELERVKYLLEEQGITVEDYPETIEKSRPKIILRSGMTQTNIKIEQQQIQSSLIPYRKSDKWGYCTQDKKIVIDCEFDMVFRFTEGFGRVKKNKLYGFIDREGNLLTDIKYEVAGEFKEGFAGVTEDFHKWNFINKRGEIVFDLKGFEDVQNFHNGYAGVVKNDKLGYININGEQVIPPIYDYYGFDDSMRNQFWHEIYDGDAAFGSSNISNFQEGYIRLKKNKKYGFADTNGNIVVPFIYDRAEDFSEGLAHVGINSKENGLIINSGYIDNTGEYVIPLKYTFDYMKAWDYWRQSRFSEGMALVRYVHPLFGTSDEEFFIDKKDKKVSVSRSHKLCSGFSEGLAVVGREYGEYKFLEGRVTKYGYIDKSGNVAIECCFDWAQPFSDGLAAIKMNGNYGFIDKSGKIVIDCRYAKDFRRNRFINGLFFVHSKKSHSPGQGYINKMGVEFWKD